MFVYVSVMFIYIINNADKKTTGRKFKKNLKIEFAVNVENEMWEQNCSKSIIGPNPT